MKVIFSFTNGQVNGTKQKEVEFDDNTTDDEIEEAFNDWLHSTSEATWWKE